MTLWKSREEMKAFARSGAHLEAMKKTATIAKVVRTLTIEASALPEWTDAKTLLFKSGKVLTL